MSFGFSELPTEGERGPPSLANLCVGEISNYVRLWFASKILDDPKIRTGAAEKEEEGEGFFLSDSDEEGEDIEIDTLTLRTPQLAAEIDETFEELAMILTSEQKGNLLSIVAQKSQGFGFEHCEAWVNALAAEAETLDLSACSKLDARALRAMLHCAPFSSSRQLNLSKCGNLFTPALLAESAPHWPHLQELRLSGGLVAPGPADAALMRVAAVCHRLRLLDLAACNALGDPAIREILGRCSELEVLDISRCVKVTDEAFSTPLASSSLKVLHLVGCRVSDTSMRYLGASGNRVALEELHALGTFISGAAISALPGLDKLRWLDVGELEVHDRDLDLISGTARALTTLDLSWCDLVTDSGIHTLSSSCNGLTSLNLRKCQVSDAALEAVGQYCSSLQRLGIALCEQISDRGVQAVCEGCRELQVLDVSWCSQLSGEGLLTVVSTLSKLASLSLQGCKPVENRHLQVAQEVLTDLRQLSIAWCNLPSSEAISALTAALPKLSVYDYYHIRHDGSLVTEVNPT
eukprot:CAMPEP_0177716790 /NCGR_PEP_ID=MMETSP0484_2-20121128/14690_1 /TAXON_ID=354590 /ORGANISM="Rhodomonas lens, Strain RHODO" /LENGTH=520 /DNA_ID=CAMNT_0019228829 /DNA_START=102 /DNA_END=1665 /DNA_ORIENTATION=-